MPSSAVADSGLVAPVGDGELDLAALRPSGFATLARRVRRSPTAMVGLVILVTWIVCAIAWPVLAPYDPTQFHTSARLQPPSTQFFFGTDQFGRDVFSRVLAGSRDILIVAPLATLVGIVCGTCLGLIAGYYRGVVGEGVLRVMDAIMAFPVVTLTLLVVAILGPSVVNVIMVIGLVFTPRVARVVYASVLSVRDLNYVPRPRACAVNPTATFCSARSCRRSPRQLSSKAPYALAMRFSPARRSAFWDSAFHLRRPTGDCKSPRRAPSSSPRRGRSSSRRWRSLRWSSASTWCPTDCRTEPAARDAHRCSAGREPVGRLWALPAVHDLAFQIDRGEAYGLVGESGSGKSTVAMALVRYLARSGR